jgi:DNA-binding HxlR family transcriptional regulator
MKNIAFVANRQPETVSHDELIAVMQENKEYTQDQVMALLADRPRASVRDTLHSLVDRGIVWRENRTKNDSRVRYTLLEGEALREAIDRKTTRGETPAWMQSDLIGYEATNKRHQELCMTVRR